MLKITQLFGIAFSQISLYFSSSNSLYLHMSIDPKAQPRGFSEA